MHCDPLSRKSPWGLSLNPKMLKMEFEAIGTYVDLNGIQAAVLAALSNVMLPEKVFYILMLWSRSNGRKLSMVSRFFCCWFLNSHTH